MKEKKVSFSVQKEKNIRPSWNAKTFVIMILTRTIWNIPTNNFILFFKSFKRFYLFKKELSASSRYLHLKCIFYQDN